MTDSVDELSARARRGELSRAEQQRLDVCLKASVEARLWHEAGKELDAEGAILPGDHAAVERVLQRAFSALPPLPASPVRSSSFVRSRRPRVGLLLAVGLLLFVSIAAASVEGVRYWHARVKLQQLGATAPKPGRRAAAPVARALPPAVTASVATPSAPSEANGTVTAPSVSASSPFVSASQPASSTERPARARASAETVSAAAELFGAAALARREGNAVKAIALLDGLQERFSGSREAHVADMTLGALHLQRGAPAAALEHFRHYLRTTPQGELASEAAWGECRALSSLGQRAEAQRCLQLLVARYPGSAYAAAARAKLKAELAGP